MVWWGGGSGGGNGGVHLIKQSLARYFSRQRAVNVRRVNPKVPFPEAVSIAESLYNIIKERGPLTVGNTWNFAKEANVNGLNSKTHMKIMLKWMRGKQMLKLFCNQVGSNKKFLHRILPEEPGKEPPIHEAEQILQTKKPSIKRKKQHK